MNKDDGFSGLEAAIVLIAFVVVATVFAYATLGSGFYVSDKAQQTVHQGTKTASTSVYQEGGIYGTMHADTQQLDRLFFTIYVPDGAENQDLTEMIISYTQSDVSNPREYKWSETAANPDHFYAQGLDLLHAGKNVKIELADVKGPRTGGWFTIELRPKTGSPVFVKRWIEQGFDGGVII